MINQNKTIQLPVYTKDVWEYTTHRSKKDYEVFMGDHSLTYAIDQALTEMGIFSEEEDGYLAPPSMKVRVVCLDESYITWLNGRPHTRELVEEYAQELGDDDLLKLLQKNRMDVSYELCCIPLIVASKKKLDNGFALSSDTIHAIQKMLNDVYGEGRAFFTGTVRTMQQIHREEPRYFEMADRWFLDKGPDRFLSPVGDVVPYGGVYFFGVPFVVCYRHTSAVYTIRQIANGLDEHGMTDAALTPTNFLTEDGEIEEDMEEALGSIPDMLFSDFCRQIKGTEDNLLFSNTIWISSYEIVDYMDNTVLGILHKAL